MGYTHYWGAPALTRPAMIEIGDFVAKVIKVTEGKPTNTAGGYHKEPVKICGANGSGKPVLTEEEITLNGNGPDLDHETFSVTLSGGRDFCKTARKPYDVVVVATLAYCAAKHGFTVSSDGDTGDWETGVELATRIAGEPIPCPIIVAELTD